MSTDTEKDWLQIGVKVNTPQGIQTVTRITEDDGVYVTCGNYCRTELSQVPEAFVPVVGEACEYTAIKSHNGEYSAVEAGRWYECKEIIAFHGGFVWTSDNGLRLLSNTIFRPIKTERERVIEWAMKEWMREDHSTTENLFGSMYDLGALTMPESK